VTKEKNFATIV